MDDKTYRSYEQRARQEQKITVPLAALPLVLQQKYVAIQQARAMLREMQQEFERALADRLGD